MNMEDGSTSTLRMRPSNGETLEVAVMISTFKQLKLRKVAVGFVKLLCWHLGRSVDSIKCSSIGVVPIIEPSLYLETSRSASKLAAWVTILEAKNNSKEMSMSNNSSSAMTCHNLMIPKEVQRQFGNLLQTNYTQRWSL